VLSYLVAKGIDPKRVSASALGATKLLDTSPSRSIAA
jgi:hypothetical protein